MKITKLSIPVLLSFMMLGCGEKEQLGIDPQVYTDSLFAVMNADRANYTKLVVKRLGPEGSGAINPNEHWKEVENGVPLPAQMFRAGAEKVGETTDTFSYSLQSLWPINKQNAPRTEKEVEGLQFIVDNPGQNFYATEKLGGKNYFTAVYADIAVSIACVACHNAHKDSPRTDFELDEVMGGVVIRVPLKN